VESKKSHFQQYYSYILQIIYVISEENKLLSPYPPHLKMSPHYPVKCKTLHLTEGNVAFLQMLMALKKPVGVGIGGSER